MLSIQTRKELNLIKLNLENKIDAINNMLDLDLVDMADKAEPIKRDYKLSKKTTKKKKSYDLAFKDKTTVAVIDKKKKWSNKYAECIECGTTVEVYKANGMCKKCYNIDSNLKRQKVQKIKNIKHNVLNTFHCNDCDHDWEDKRPFGETTICPECSSAFVVQK